MLQSSLLAVLTEGWIDTAIHFAILFALVIGEIYFNRPFNKTLVPAALFLLLGCLVWLFSGLPDIIDLTILVWCCQKSRFQGYRPCLNSNHYFIITLDNFIISIGHHC